MSLSVQVGDIRYFEVPERGGATIRWGATIRGNTVSHLTCKLNKFSKGPSSLQIDPFLFKHIPVYDFRILFGRQVELPCHQICASPDSQCSNFHSILKKVLNYQLA